MESLGDILRKEREKRGLLLRHIGAKLDVDQALISKFERGDRIPTKEQIVKLSKIFDINENELTAHWLADKILIGLRNEKMALRAVTLVAEEIKSVKK